MSTPQTFKWLWIGYVWPEEQSSAAGVRTLELIRYLVKNGQEIHFVSAAKNEKNAPALAELGVKTHPVLLNHSSFDQLVEELAPEIVVYDRFISEEQFGWRVRKSAPQAMSILDTQDLHFLRRARQKGSQEYLGDDFYREMASILRCDQTLLVSDYEESFLKYEVNLESDLLETVPIGYMVSPLAATPFEERKNFCWLGNFQHQPNQDGLRVFLNEVWPLIFQKKPDAEIHVYGAYMTQEFSERNNPKKGIHMKGWVKDPLEMLAKHRVNLAPLRFGAGTKGKVTQGWSAGTPVITTSIGSEGLVRGGRFAGSIVSLDTPESFAEACISLHEDQTDWQAKHEMGISLIQKYFNPDQIGERFLTKVIQLQAKLEEHRKKHWMSSLLNLQSLRSNEYFSRWIEAKESQPRVDSE